MGSTRPFFLQRPRLRSQCFFTAGSTRDCLEYVDILGDDPKHQGDNVCLLCPALRNGGSSMFRGPRCARRRGFVDLIADVDKVGGLLFLRFLLAVARQESFDGDGVEWPPAPEDSRWWRLSFKSASSFFRLPSKPLSDSSCLFLFRNATRKLSDLSAKELCDDPEPSVEVLDSFRKAASWGCGQYKLRLDS